MSAMNNRCLGLILTIAMITSLWSIDSGIAQTTETVPKLVDIGVVLDLHPLGMQIPPNRGPRHNYLVSTYSFVAEGLNSLKRLWKTRVTYFLCDDSLSAITLDQVGESEYYPVSEKDRDLLENVVYKQQTDDHSGRPQKARDILNDDKSFRRPQLVIWIVAYDSSQGDQKAYDLVHQLKNAPNGPDIVVAVRQHFSFASSDTPTVVLDDTNHTNSDDLVSELRRTIPATVKKLLNLCNSTLTKTGCYFKSKDVCEEDHIHTPQAGIDQNFVKYCTSGTADIFNCSINDCNFRCHDEVNRIETIPCNATCGTTGWKSTLPANLKYCPTRIDSCTGPPCTEPVTTTSIGVTAKKSHSGIWLITAISIGFAAVVASG